MKCNGELYECLKKITRFDIKQSMAQINKN